jgi:hypothetical protein
VLSPNGPAVIKRAVHSGLAKKLTDADFTTVIASPAHPGLPSTDSPESPAFLVNRR